MGKSIGVGVSRLRANGYQQQLGSTFCACMLPIATKVDIAIMKCKYPLIQHREICLFDWICRSCSSYSCRYVTSRRC